MSIDISTRRWLAGGLAVVLLTTGCQSQKISRQRSEDLIGQPHAQAAAASMPTDREKAAVMVEMARALERRGQHEQALQAYDAIAKKKPAYAALACHRSAVICDRLGQADRAEVFYQQAFAAGKPSPQLLCDHGYSLFLRGRLDEARGQLTKSLELRPDDARTHNNLALVCARSGRLDEALRQFGLGRDPRQARQSLDLLLASQPSAAPSGPVEAAPAEAPAATGSPGRAPEQVASAPGRPAPAPTPAASPAPASASYRAASLTPTPVPASSASSSPGRAASAPTAAAGAPPLAASPTSASPTPAPPAPVASASSGVGAAGRYSHGGGRRLSAAADRCRVAAAASRVSGAASRGGGPACGRQRAACRPLGARSPRRLGGRRGRGSPSRGRQRRERDQQDRRGRPDRAATSTRRVAAAQAHNAEDAAVRTSQSAATSHDELAAKPAADFGDREVAAPEVPAAGEGTPEVAEASSLPPAPVPSRVPVGEQLPAAAVVAAGPPAESPEAASLPAESERLAAADDDLGPMESPLAMTARQPDAAGQPELVRRPDIELIFAPLQQLDPTAVPDIGWSAAESDGTVDVATLELSGTAPIEPHGGAADIILRDGTATLAEAAEGEEGNFLKIVP